MLRARSADRLSDGHLIALGQVAALQRDLLGAGGADRNRDAFERAARGADPDAVATVGNSHAGRLEA